MQDSDYPGLFCASDAASRDAQEAYSRVLAAQLTLFFLVAFLGATVRLFPVPAQRHVSVAMAVLLSLAILVSFVGRERKFDKTWFDGRALAESTKTAVWRYMMGTAPFQPDTGHDADASFIAELDEIRKARAGIDEHLSGRATDAKPISDFMRRIRASDLASRKTTYLQDRVRDQKTWYAVKAAWNKRRKSLWYWIGLSLQAAALVLAILAAVYGPFAFNAVGVLMTLAASATAWAQAKRHDELSNSYSLAAQELQHIEALIERVNDDDAFRTLVNQGEEAISREHTMWCARRSVSVSGTKRG